MDDSFNIIKQEQKDKNQHQFTSWDKFIDFLDKLNGSNGNGSSNNSNNSNSSKGTSNHTTSKKTSSTGTLGRSSKRMARFFLCEQTKSIDAMHVLKKTCHLLEHCFDDTIKRKEMRDIVQQIGTTRLPLPLCQPFILTMENGKKKFDSISTLDYFRLNRSLKGKKMQNEKKNCDAQLFESKSGAHEFLNNTKNYFNYLTEPFQIDPIDMSSLLKFSSIVPPLWQITFLLLCGTDTALESLINTTVSTNQQQEEKETSAVAAARNMSPITKTSVNNKTMFTRRNQEENEEDSSNVHDENPIQRTKSGKRICDYNLQVFKKISTKKKIYKTPSVGSIAFINNRIILSWINYIDWFLSKFATISN